MKVKSETTAEEEVKEAETEAEEVEAVNQKSGSEVN